MNDTVGLSPTADDRRRGREPAARRRTESPARRRPEPARPRTEPPPWLLLVHQIPPKPDALRARVGRRLQRLGAVPIKNSVYVLPNREESREDAQWLRAEIVEAGGEALVCEAAFVDGLTDGDVAALFREARAADWLAIAAEARAVAKELAARSRGPSPEAAETAGEARTRAERELARLDRRAAAVEDLDFFRAPEREEAKMAIEEARRAIRRPATGGEQAGTDRAATEPDRPLGGTWTTRRNPRVDRVSSAWLIRRFVDRAARFRFVDPAAPRRRGELRFDMADADFGHEGDRCTFETLVRRFAPRDPALRQVAEIVHDVDLKDGKFGREEAPGVARLVDGIAATAADDAERLARGAEVFETLYAAFGGAAPGPARTGASRRRAR